MTWEAFLGSGIVGGVVGGFAGAIFGGLISYKVARSIQSREHKYQDEIRKKEKEEQQEKHLQEIALNGMQKDILKFCLRYPSKRYELESHSGASWLISCDMDEKKEMLELKVKGQIRSMISKGYVEELTDFGSSYVFELTEQGKNFPLEEV